MRNMISAALMGLMCVVAFGQGAQLETRVFDIGSMIERGARIESWPVTLPLHAAFAAIGSPEPSWDMEPDGLSSDTAMDLLSVAIGERHWQAEGVMRDVRGARIWITHKKEILDRFGATLAYLERAASQSAVVRVYELPVAAVDALPGKVILSARETAALLNTGKPLAASSVRIHDGGTQRIRSGRSHSFVADYDVEVASDAEIADPVVAILRTGLDVNVLMRILPTGQYYLRVGGRLSRVLSWRDHDPMSTWVGKLQMPRIATTSVAGTGLVEPGGSIALGLAGEHGGHLILVQVSGQPDTGTVGTERLRVIPAGLAGEENWILPPMSVPGPAATGRLNREIATNVGDRDADAILEGDHLSELIRRTVQPPIWDEAEGVSLQHQRPYFLLVGPEDLLNETQRRLVEVHQQVVQARSLEFRAGLVSSSDGITIAAGKGDLESVASTLKERGCVATRVGDQFRLINGIETAYLKDHDPEIAEEATISDPQVDTFFTGLAIHGHVTASSEGGTVLHGEFVYRDLVEPIASFHGNANDVGLVETPVTTSWQGRVDLPLEPGRWMLIGVAPLQEEERSLVILARVTKP